MKSFRHTGKKKYAAAVPGLLLLILMLLAWAGCTGQAGHGHGAGDGHESHDEHAGHDEHGGHDEHEGHEDREDHKARGHGEENGLRVELTPEQRRRIGLETALAGPGKISVVAEFPGELELNPDGVAHVAPRAPGVVEEVYKDLGDRVYKGEAMASIHSRELADAVSEHQSASKRVSLAWRTYKREKELWEKRITAKQDYLEAKTRYAEARIGRDSARQKLRALGFSEDEIDGLGGGGDSGYTRHEIRAPFDATVIGKRVSRGEFVADSDEAFVVADLSSVWALFTVYQKDLPLVKEGQAARVYIGPGDFREGTIDYVSPVLDKRTRGGQARIVLDNGGGSLRPGLFVTVRLEGESIDARVVVPKSAVQVLEEREVVFVEDGGGFVPVHVTLGPADGENVAVTSGLAPGRRYAARGAFDLKAKIVSGGLDPHAGHGH